MKAIIILFIMIFLHIIDDYCLQSFSLCNLKQKDYWKAQEGYNNKYKNDYIAALLAHAFSWSFMIHIPIMILNWIYFSNSRIHIIVFTLSIVFNFIIHASVDNIKANLKWINLIDDQLIHFLQIFVTWVIYNCLPNVNNLLAFGEVL